MLALQPYDAMIKAHDNSNCPLLYFARFGFRDFNFTRTGDSFAFCESFSIAAAA